MAQAILLQPVETLGERGEVVDVSAGYLRNFLVPRKLAQPATKASIAAAQQRIQAAEQEAAEQAERAEENAPAAAQDRAHDLAPGGRRRPAVRLGHRTGDRRRRARRRAA